jgi:hypothetical protein
MDFYGIIKKINELRKELEQISLSAIEKDIIKTKISETYLLLFEEQEVVQEKINVDYKTLVDTFLEKEPSAKQPLPENQSVLSKISQTKIVDLKRSIAMNDRFIFIKELFKNDFDTYNRSINDLNGCETLQQAEQYLTQLKQQYEWDETNETVQYFLALIGRKFC